MNISSISDVILASGDGDTLQRLSAIAIVWMGIVNTLLMFATLWTVLKLPGHDEGGLWPIFVPEHYSEKTSQHLLDPYSFAHVSHGAIGFIVAFLTGSCFHSFPIS